MLNTMQLLKQDRVEQSKVDVFDYLKGLRWPTNTQKLGERHGTDYASYSSEGTDPENTVILDFHPLEL